MATPAELGFRFPAEWSRHAATWLTWPWTGGCSFPDNYDDAQRVYAELIKTLAPHETVRVNVWDAETEGWVREVLSGYDTPLTNVEFHHHPSREPWCRDHGPIYVVNEAGERAIINWGYNAWGGKYPPWDEDDAIPQRIADLQQLPSFAAGMILEGGSIDTNGAGVLMTTESCLLNPNRNPDLTREQIEQRLKDYLGIDHILWLGDGIVGDDTDGHIDDLARFVSRDTIVTIVEDDPADENHAALQDNLQRLRTLQNQTGEPFRIVELPMPTARYWGDLRLPASYANFYIANDIVIVPTFDDPNDARAIDILQAEFPDRKVLGLDSTDLIIGQGSFHCITQQEPA
jgi:agmatine deiminase